MSNTKASTSHPPADATNVASTPATAQTNPAPVTEEHKKHGLGAILDKIVHPHGHGHGEEHHHHKEHKDKQKEGDAAAAPFNAHVEVAVPETVSDGAAHLAPAGNAVGGVL